MGFTEIDDYMDVEELPVECDNCQDKGEVLEVVNGQERMVFCGCKRGLELMQNREKQLAEPIPYTGEGMVKEQTRREKIDEIMDTIELMDEMERLEKEDDAEVEEIMEIEEMINEARQRESRDLLNDDNDE